jgi:hypothetical protein
MAAQRRSNVWFTSQPEQADRYVAKGRHDLGRRTTTYLTPIFVKGHVSDPMNTVLNAPMTAPESENLSGVGLLGR